MPLMSSIEGAFCRSAPWREFARRLVLPWALDDSELVGEVLEIGSGSGAMADAVARAFPDVRLTVTDVDEGMVDSARRRLKGRRNVCVVPADVTDLPFADARFDAVTSYLMLHHVINWPGALAEAARVLRPGGLLVGYDLTDTPVARLIHRVDRSPHLMVAPTDLRTGLLQVDLTNVSVRTAARGHLMRFRAVKPAGSP